MAGGLNESDLVTPTQHYLSDNESDIGAAEEPPFSSPVKDDFADDEEVDPWSCDRWDSPDMLLSTSSAKSKNGCEEGTAQQ